MSTTQESRLQAFVSRLTPSQRTKFAGKINQIQQNIDSNKSGQRNYGDYSRPETNYNHDNEYGRTQSIYQRDTGLVDQPKVAQPSLSDIARNAISNNQLPTQSNVSGLFKNQVDNVLSEEDEQKKKDQAESSAKGTLLVKAVTANTDKLTNAEIEKAHLIKGSKIFSKTNGNFDAVRTYLDSKGMEDFKIDKELSTDDTLVTESPSGIDMSHRGTDKTSLSDWKANADVLLNNESENPKFMRSRELYNKVKAKYPTPEIHTSGFSLGGAVAKDLSNFHDLKTTIFNPHMGLGGSWDPKEEATIIRTTTDAPSMGTALTKRGNNVKLKTLNPVENSFNPIKSHNLENFTNTTSTRAQDNKASEHLKNILDQGAKASEATLLNESELNADAGLTFTDHIAKFNGNSTNGRDNLLDPEGNNILSKGISPESGSVRAWKDVGGNFTKGEVDSLLDNKEGVHADQDEPATEARNKELMDKISDIHDGPNDVGMSVTDREDYVNSDTQDRKDYVDEAIDSSNESIDAMNTFDDHISIANPGLMDSFKTSLHPSSLAHGLLAGYASNKLVNLVDPNKKIPELARTGIEGGVSGVASGLLGTALGIGGEASLLTEGVSGIAGYETQKYSKKGIDFLEDKISSGASQTEVGSDISDTLSDISAGAVSGAIIGGVPGALVGAGLGLAIGGATSIYHHFF